MTKTRYYKLKFIVSAKFMAISLSNRVDNLAEGIHKMKCKRGHVKKVKRVELVVSAGLNTQTLKIKMI